MNDERLPVFLGKVVEGLRRERPVEDVHRRPADLNEIVLVPRRRYKYECKNRRNDKNEQRGWQKPFCSPSPKRSECDLTRSVMFSEEVRSNQVPRDYEEDINTNESTA
ncbi:hypothetical protein GCM10010922_13150 [Microbacterium sorbitolivorans]|nr:hypothetical protein GCM10010922_13150 [Microbacterium sorbitolivorans]